MFSYVDLTFCAYISGWCMLDTTGFSPRPNHGFESLPPGSVVVCISVVLVQPPGLSVGPP